ncbi:hypothetical protein [Ulvibacter litoralis]|uniref:Uncharacterized protein n=1 Tax=Ulvibacter litoralis TaxID=227084 RepID=A0A1G7D2H4_9FLAO|nr:hypothetical protein [Ulvibacter litoralis]GHC45128.1 hypothetical protein GCM10008083_04780 [Ulvibacter litoralis]SDE45693.1 hypothetical protein SAMN05421855_101726 [Ulvibacter litoralis]
MKKSLIILLLLIVTVGFSQEDPIQVPQIGVKVAVGQTVQFEKASVTFIKVIADSRCPKNTTCIWAGEVKVLASVTEDGKEPKEVELVFGKEVQNTLISSEGYTLKCLSVTPYPSSEDNGERDYALLVSEGK